ncbi:IS110 family transposase [Aliidiomarina iranensis]|uniref:IS110 family transposase n=1 Tax=Aliidiomarina iranensis TaxID=1434071 RepID=A0A432VP89_9GAMM|nr:IS110 family transposase [Aliidiomarina iranensis]RUO17969.1 IS110 family transposase [Aliidiomarina iranensis]
MKVTTISIDLAKSVFQVCGTNQAGTQVFNRQVRRNKLLETVIQFPDADVVMEACSGSNYWGRLFIKHGFTVKLIPPQHVKPFVRGNKNDRNDAFAISEASRRPNLTFTQPRSVAATDMAVLHRIRDRRQGSLTRLTNQIRGLLNEYGIVIPQGIEHLRRHIPLILEDGENELSPLMRSELHSLFDEWCMMESLIKQHDKAIEQFARADEQTTLLMTARGIGSITATALMSVMGSPANYKNGRHFAASLGLTPSEHSSGGKQKLGRITKRGNRYVRRLLVQCAMSHVRHLESRTDNLSLWLKKLKERRGVQVAAIALANKLARISWAMLHKQQEFKLN